MFSVYGLFKPSFALELGLNRLKEKGFIDQKLIVVTLENVPPARQTLLDSMYRNDGMSLLDGIAISASVGMVLGVIYGYSVYIGPIALGLIGAFTGGVSGFIIDRAIRRKKNEQTTPSSGEIIVAVNCNSEGEASVAERIFVENNAVAMGRGPKVFS